MYDASVQAGSSNMEIKEEDEGQQQLDVAIGAEAELPFERPHKRKRKGDCYQPFTAEEKKRLKEYEKLESETRKILNTTYVKLFDVLSRGNMPEGINYLKDRLTTLKQKTSLDPICIGFLGRTGAGKTSLLNAIIGKNLFLPVSSSSVCTSCVVKVNTSRNSQYEATIHLLSEQEWKDELQNLAAVLSKNEEEDEDEDDDDEDDDNGAVRDDAAEKLRALYGSGAETKSYEELLKTRRLVTIPAKRSVQIKEETEKAFSEKLDPYIRVSEEGKNALWPLVKYAELTIPGSDLVPEGITFMDIPGTGDSNKKRSEVWKQSIDKCSVIWIISSIERVQGEKVQEVLMNETIKACVGGICTDFAMIVTKSDMLTLDVYNRERKNTSAPPENEHDAILERNEAVKGNQRNRIMKKLKKRLSPDSEILGDSHSLVYMVSTTEFWNPKHLSQDETALYSRALKDFQAFPEATGKLYPVALGIPELRDYIRKIYMIRKKNLVADYISEALGVLLLAENINSEESRVEQVFQESGIEKFIMQEIDALGMNLSQCFEAIEEPLCMGVKEAKGSYKKVVERLLTRGKNQGFHRTLKAVCLNKGEYSSRSFARIDLNEDLARPMYGKIDATFESIFRIQRSTRANLWSQLDMFKSNVESKIHSMKQDKTLFQDNYCSKTKLFINEINVIMRKLEEEILQKKAVIYRTLSVAIQTCLRPYYEEASKIQGRDSCERMKKILRNNVEKEVTDEMFETAKSKMKSHFLALQEAITVKLKKEMTTLLKLILLQHKQLAVKLPDVEDECNEIKELKRDLENP